MTENGREMEGGRMERGRTRKMGRIKEEKVNGSKKKRQRKCARVRIRKGKEEGKIDKDREDEGGKGEWRVERKGNLCRRKTQAVE